MNLTLKRGLIAGVVLLIIGFGISSLLGIIFPQLSQEYQSGLFRPWTDPLMMAYFGHPLIMGFALSYLWGLVSDQWKRTKPVGKALQFAKIYFLIATIPGMFVSYTSFQISLFMILTWTLMGFAQVFIAGWIFARMEK